MDSRFIGRSEEMSLLEGVYSRPGPKTYAVYGRRRVGKSRLLKEFCRDKRALTFQFVQRSLQENLEISGYVVSDFLGREVGFRTLAAFLHQLGEICAEAKTVVVFDEFPYLYGGDSMVSSSVQRFVDRDLEGTESMLVICGSSVSMMRDLIESRSQPMYGRFENRMNLRPLALAQCTEFHPGMEDADLLRTYLTVGGVPQYHTEMSGGTYRECMERAFFSEGSWMGEEFSRVVEAELTPVDVFSRMLSAIAGGADTQGAVANEVGISRSLCSRYISRLEATGYVERYEPALNMKEGRFYRISDPLLSFGYSVIRLNGFGVGGRSPELIYRRCLPAINSYMGRALEAVASQYIAESYRPRLLTKWFGTVDGERTDIDVVAEVEAADGSVVTILCECKFRTAKADFRELNLLERRADAAGCRNNRRLMIVSVGGFSERLEEYAEDCGVLLVGTDKLLGRAPPDPIWRGRSGPSRPPVAAAAVYGLVPAGADADDVDGGLRVPPGELDVLAHLAGQLVVAALNQGVGVVPAPPALEGLVDGLGPVEPGDRRGEVPDLLAVYLVRDADRELRHVVQHVDLGHREGREPAHPLGVLQDDEVQPPAAPPAAGGHAELPAPALERLALLAAELGDERPLADAGGVRLDDAEEPLYPVGGHAGPGADAPAAGGGGGHVWVGAVVDVEHGALGALEYDVPPLVELVVYQDGRVADAPADGVPPAGHLGVQGLGGAGAGLRAHEVQHVLLVREDEGDLVVQDRVVQEVSRAEAYPRDFVLVGRADALAGGADHVLAAVLLLRAVQLLVVVHDEVGAVGYAEAVDAAPGREDLVDLLGQLLQVHDDAVADDGELALADHAGRQPVELEDLPVDHDRVAGVVAPLEADDGVGVLRQVVRDLAFPLVSPLRSYDG